MGFLKPVKAGNPRRTRRRPIRMLLHRAATGDTDAYAELTGAYFDLIIEYVSLCNIGQEETIRRTEILLCEGWQRLPYLKRLSDWERFLTTALLAIPNEKISSSTKYPQELLRLAPQQKFALIASGFENWSHPWLALALRVEPRELRQILLETRCRLLQINRDSLPKKTRQNLVLISANFDEQLTAAQQQNALQIVSDCEVTRTFKSSWLALFCKLIEIRQQIRLPEEERNEFLQRVCRGLRHEKMLRPSLASRIRNLISFDDLPATDPAGGNHRLRYGD